MSASSANAIDLDNLPDFRPFPAVATRVMAAYDDPNFEPSQIAEIIKCDPTISMRMLSVANSPMYGFSNTITTIEQATVVMGFRAAKNLVMSIAASAVFDAEPSTREAAAQLWQHSLGCAAVARRIAKQVNVCPDEAFLAAVVHDVGKLILLDADQQAYLDATRNVDSSRITDVEMESFGLTHTDLGERYGAACGLPSEIIDAIACHHDPAAAETCGQLAGVICVANSMAISLGLGQQPQETESISAALTRSTFALDQSEIDNISEVAMLDYEALRDACG